MAGVSRQLSDDHRICLRMDWSTFEAVLRHKGESPIPRVSYLDGVMEAVVPGKFHEGTAGLIGRLVEIWADHHEIPLETTKSWTLKNRLKEAGVEPDESWVVGDRPGAELPDLALEFVHTSGTLDKLEIYARLGVREVWFWIDGVLSIHVLRGGRYVRATRSHVLRGIDLDQLMHFVTHVSPARARLRYRAALEKRRR
jgi:Uma2 family endonuclease